MKKIVCIAGLTLGGIAFQANAQPPQSPLAGPIETAAGTMYLLPTTALTVDVVIQKETIRSGPYARYAQKYLGVMAPLADKEIYSITDAALSYSNGTETPAPVLIQAPLAGSHGKFGAPAAAGDFSHVRFDDRGIDPVRSERTLVSHTESDTSFVRVAPNRTEVVEKSPEEMARDAANTIFSLRKKRLDLITGDAGENVFGAGMRAALDEIARLENEYLALFLGKHYVQQQVRRIPVVPDEGKTSYIVFRFSSSAGLLGETDLTGRPILLELRPEGRAKAADLPQRGAKDNRPGTLIRVADMVNCRLLDGKTELASRRIPIYQFGATIDVPVGGK